MASRVWRGLQDPLAFAGVQNISVLGHGMRFVAGGSHDGMFPLQRFVRWVHDKDSGIGPQRGI